MAFLRDCGSFLPGELHRDALAVGRSSPDGYGKVALKHSMIREGRMQPNLSSSDDRRD
jgi:hypothetical protein